MPRPYRVKYGSFIGYTALCLSLGMVTLYLPFSPSALVWPQEWMIVLGGTAVGAVLYVWAWIAKR